MKMNGNYLKKNGIIGTLKVTGWFEYVLTKNGSNENGIDLDTTKLNLEKERFKSKHLSTVDVCDLVEFGIANEDDCNTLYECIRQLIEKYLRPKQGVTKSLIKCGKDRCKKQEKESTIVVFNDDINPALKQKYLCPISQKLMKNPIIAFDTYEKENIIKYLNDNRKMSNSNEKVCNVAMAINDLIINRRMKQEIEKNCPIQAKIENEEEDFDINLITLGGHSEEMKKKI